MAAASLTMAAAAAASIRIFGNRDPQSGVFVRESATSRRLFGARNEANVVRTAGLLSREENWMNFGCAEPRFPDLARVSRKTAEAELDTTEEAFVEPLTGIRLLKFVAPPGASAALCLVGAGVREKSFAFIKVKVYVVALYVDPSATSFFEAWRGKDGHELEKDEKFFETLATVPVERALQIVLARDIDGGQFWSALHEALTPRLKSTGGIRALEDLGMIFKDRELKQGTSVFLTFIQSSTLQISISNATMSTSSPNASIESSEMLSALFDVYFGRNPVVPAARLAVANGIASSLRV